MVEVCESILSKKRRKYKFRQTIVIARPKLILTRPRRYIVKGKNPKSFSWRTWRTGMDFLPPLTSSTWLNKIGKKYGSKTRCLQFLTRPASTWEGDWCRSNKIENGRKRKTTYENSITKDCNWLNRRSSSGRKTSQIKTCKESSK